MDAHERLLLTDPVYARVYHALAGPLPSVTVIVLQVPPPCPRVAVTPVRVRARRPWRVPRFRPPDGQAAVGALVVAGCVLGERDPVCTSLWCAAACLVYVARMSLWRMAKRSRVGSVAYAFFASAAPGANWSHVVRLC